MEISRTKRIKIKMTSQSWPKKNLRKKTRKLTLKRKLSKQRKEPWRKFWPNIRRVAVLALIQAKTIKSQIHSKRLLNRFNKWNCFPASSSLSQGPEHSNLLRVSTPKWTLQMAILKGSSGNLSSKSCKGLMSVIGSYPRSKRWQLCLLEGSVCITLVCYNF